MIVTMQPIDCIVGTSRRAIRPIMMPAKRPEIIPLISMGIANHICRLCDDTRVKRVWPEPAGDLTEAEILAAYPWPLDGGEPWVRANMVMSLDGAIAGPDGRSKSISSPADRRLFALLREDADVLLVGARTVREENYGPTTKPLAIVSATLDLPASLAMFAEATKATPRPLLLASEAAIQQAPTDLADRIDLIPCGEHKVELADAIAVLAQRGLLRIHCEGGPTLLTGLLLAQQLNELLLTISPVLVGSPTHLVNEPLQHASAAQPQQVLTEAGSVFLRLLVGPDTNQ